MQFYTVMLTPPEMAFETNGFTQKVKVSQKSNFLDKVRYKGH